MRGIGLRGGIVVVAVMGVVGRGRRRRRVVRRGVVRGVVGVRVEVVRGFVMGRWIGDEYTVLGILGKCIFCVVYLTLFHAHGSH